MLDSPLPRKLFRLLLLMALSFPVQSCETDGETGAPVIFTGEAQILNDTLALLSARLSNPGEVEIESAGFIWGVHAWDEEGIVLEYPGYPAEDFSLQTNHALLPGRTHYARAYVRTASSMILGREVSFPGPATGPQVGTWTSLVLNPGWGTAYLNSYFVLGGELYLVFAYEGIQRFDFDTGELVPALPHHPVSYDTEFSVVRQDEAYLFSGSSLYLFDPSGSEPALISTNSQLPPGLRSYGFLVGDRIYVSGDRTGDYNLKEEFWAYDIPEDRWEQIADFPARRTTPFYFVSGGLAYIGGGMNVHRWKLYDLWAYDPGTGQWTEKEAMPGDDEQYALQAAGLGSKAYAFNGGFLHEYNSIFNTWEGIGRVWTDVPDYQPYLFVKDNRLHALRLEYNNGVYYVSISRYDI